MINQKMLDYEKTLSVIRSCRTSRQNNIAYHMVWNFSGMYKDSDLEYALFEACDENLTKVCGGFK